MRVHTITPYSRRFEGEIRKNHSYEGLTIAETFNQFLPLKSPIYFKREEIYGKQNFDFLSMYPVNIIIRVNARGRYTLSLVYTSPIVIDVSSVTPLYHSTIHNNVTPTHTSECNTVVIFPLCTLVYSSFTRVPSCRSIFRLLSVLFSMHKEWFLTSLTESYPYYISIGGD